MKNNNRKQELLKIAYNLFLKQGYDNTSIDEIIVEAKIAKGTYYYYFASKEETLEEVINMMIQEEVARAKEILNSPLPIPEKLVSVIAALRPSLDEAEIQNAVNQPENLRMHEKINQRIISEAIPLLKEVVREGVQKKIFRCDRIEERIRLLLVMSNHLFDDGLFTTGDVEVFIDTAEKILGAEPGALCFIKSLIQGV